jgi:probable rRNA maturation factor
MGYYIYLDIIFSAYTALTAAPRYGWSAGDELLLYVIHGALHLVGYDDQTPEAQAEMRRQEAAVLARLGLVVGHFNS